MKKVLILSYFYPPANFAGSYRMASWVKYFHRFGYKPVIITRGWNGVSNSFSDLSKASTNREVIHEDCDTHEVYYVPYKPNLRDRLIDTYGDQKLVLVRKLLTLFELLFQNFCLRVVPFYGIYRFANKYLESNEVDILIASGKPFVLFGFCNKLHKKHRVKWIADYRDPWNSIDWINKRHGILSNIEAWAERKWLKNASAVTSVTDFWAHNIGCFNGKPYFTIFNGHDFDFEVKQNTTNTFNILYLGTLYAEQDIETFARACNIALQRCPKLKVQFLGLLDDKPQASRVRAAFKGIDHCMEILPKVHHDQLQPFFNAASLCLLLTDMVTDGWFPLKTFEYLFIRKPIIYYPQFNSSIDSLMKDSGLGIATRSAEDIAGAITEAYMEWQLHGVIHTQPAEDVINSYTREVQAKKLTEVFDKILKTDKQTSRRDSIFSFVVRSGAHKLLYGIQKARNHIPVLTFHQVSDDNDSIYPPITTHDFNRLLLYIAKHFTVVDFNNFSRPSSKPKVILSFDDGYADFVENVMPMLLKLELPSIQNIIFNTVEHQNLFWTQELNILFNAIKSTNHRFQFQSPDLSFSCTPLNHESQYMYVFNKLRAFDKSSRQRVLNEMEALLPGCVHHSAPRMMTWDDIVYCSRNNVTIGSHTLSHDLLNTITDPSVLKVEIVESKQKIEEKIGTNVSVLCFPNGEYNQQSVLLAREAGYKHLLTTENYAWNPAHQQLLIPRVQMYAGSYEEMVCRVHLLHSYLKYK